MPIRPRPPLTGADLERAGDDVARTAAPAAEVVLVRADRRLMDAAVEQDGHAVWRYAFEAPGSAFSLPR